MSDCAGALQSCCWCIKDSHAPLHAGGFQRDSGISSCSFPGVTQESRQASDSGWRDAGLLTGTVNDSSVFVCVCADRRFTGMYACLHEGGRLATRTVLILLPSVFNCVSFVLAALV